MWYQKTSAELPTMAYLWSQVKPGEWRYRPVEPAGTALGVAVTRVTPTAGSSSEKEAMPDVEPGPELEPAASELLSVRPQFATPHSDLVEGSSEQCAPRLISQCLISPCLDDDGAPLWVLVCDSAARVWRNGAEVVLGLTVLRDRDEILWHGVDTRERFYFSTEQVVVVESAPAGLSGACPRCKTSIAEGEPAVCCPSCGAWHHQSDADRPCWGYSPRCGACHQQETSLDGQLQWSPAEL